MILDRIFADFGFTPVSAPELIDRYGEDYSENYLRTVLPNSEMFRGHDQEGKYPFRTERVSTGVYIVYPSMAQLRLLANVRNQVL